MFTFALIFSFILLFLSVPIFLVFGLGSSIAAIWGLNLPWSTLIQMAFESMNKHVLIAVPLFVFSGMVMLRGGAANDIIYGDGGNDTIHGDQGEDTIKGGDGNDIIYGGIGSDLLYGGPGDDKFYYDPSHINSTGTSKDTIYDFRDAGADKLVNTQTPASAFTRKSIHADATQLGSNYNITNNSNELPYVFNFTYDVPPATGGHATALSNHFSNFSITKTSGSLTQVESMYLAVGDGHESYLWFWSDDNKTGIIESSELSPVVLLGGFNNDTLNGSEFSFDGSSGVT